jgi:serine/threonine protein kinase
MPPSFDEFVQRLIRSTVLGEREVAEYLDTFPPEKLPRDGEALARMFVRDKRLTAYQASSILQGEERSLVLGDFVALAPLGKGGMGHVHRAVHRFSGHTVAIKVLRPEALRSGNAVRRFHQEVAAAMRLCHRNIVSTLEAAEQNGLHYLVMELVEGEDLGALIRLGGPQPIDPSLGYVMQAAEGLEHAHSQNVIHRDVKPANLLLDRSGTIKVLDMGLARVIEEADPGATLAERLTRRGELLGTIDYMSPEQTLDTRNADRRSDIYSLGCTLFTLLTGRPVYEGEDSFERLIAHREAEIPSLLAAVPGVSPSLDDVFRRMVAKRPADRYQSMGETRDALAKCLERHVQGGSSASSLEPVQVAPSERGEASAEPQTRSDPTRRIAGDEPTVRAPECEPDVARAELPQAVGKATIRVAGSSTVSTDE